MLQASTGLPSLGFAGDLDEADLVADIERAFAVEFGDACRAWANVGDIEASLLLLFPTEDTPGRCATAMAFHRLRRELDPARARAITTVTRLDTLMEDAPRRALAALGARLGLRMPPIASGRAGQCGVVLALLALPAEIIGIVLGAWWIGPPLFALGVAPVVRDGGRFGAMTIGTLAREMAILNAGAFAASGADRRPAAIWATLRHLVARETGVDPAGVTRATRLYD